MRGITRSQLKRSNSGHSNTVLRSEKAHNAVFDSAHPLGFATDREILSQMVWRDADVFFVPHHSNRVRN